MPMPNRRSWSIAWLLTAVGLAGCNNSAHRQTLDRRARNLERTVQALHEQEAERTEKLSRTLAALARQHERDVARAQTIPAELDRALRREVEHWERQAPGHDRRIKEQLEGDAGGIERTLPHVLY